ncbi:MAG: hypothetical protein JNK64_36010 [Myxococcales bacterium]|nr:hypothetical protein [Myxococcales bacterium]
MTQHRAVAWYRRDVGVWVIGGAIAGAILGFVAYAAHHGAPPRVTTTPLTGAALADGTALVIERVDRAESDGDGGVAVTTAYRVRRFAPSTGAELARRTLAGPVRCATAIAAMAWCTDATGATELVDGDLAPRLDASSVARAATMAPADGPWVDRTGGLLRPTPGGGWVRIDPATFATTPSDGIADPTRHPARGVAAAALGDRHVELVDRGAGRRALRRSDQEVAVEAGADVSPEPTYLADGLLATPPIALDLDGDLLLVERVATTTAARRLLRLPARGAPRWSAPLPDIVRWAVVTGDTIVVAHARGLRVVAAATGAPLP